MKSTIFFLFVVIIEQDDEALAPLILPSASEHDNMDQEFQWGLKLNG
jgi:hypothetical protein